MTDQDPTQAYNPPAPPDPTAPPPGTPAAAEPPAAPVTTSPVVAEGAKRPGRSPVKWIIAAVVVLLVAGTAAGATLMLTSTTAAGSAVEKWAPADATGYYEVRLDLPGSQQAELAEFMAAFPGFDDQAAFPTKLGEIGDRIIGGASEGAYDYQTDIAPWFGGQLGFSQGATPTSAEMQAGKLLAPMLVAISVTDAAKATAWIDGVITETGATTVTQDHAGTTITVVQSDKDTGPIELPDYGYAVVDTVVLAGDVPSLEAAIDGNGAGGLASTDEYKAARAALPGDHIVFGWADLSSTLSTFAGMESLDPSGMIAAVGSIYGQILPPWSAVSVHAEDGRLVMESASPHVSALGESPNKVDPIAGMAPADTVLLGTGHDLGARLGAIKAMVDAEPAFDEVVEQLDQVLGIVGGFEAATSWIGDAGIAITRQGDAVDGGLIIAPADAASAERLFTSLRTMIEVGAGGMLTFVEEEYNGATIVSLDLTALAGLGAEMSGIEGSLIPPELKLAWAAEDDVVVIGVGSQFVKDVLDARTGESLADQERYSALIEAAGNENSGVVWVDITGIRTMVEPLLPEEVAAAYERDVKPYLEPLDALGGATVSGGDIDRSTIYLTTTE